MRHADQIDIDYREPVTYARGAWRLCVILGMVLGSWVIMFAALVAVGWCASCFVGCKTVDWKALIPTNAVPSTVTTTTLPTTTPTTIPPAPADPVKPLPYSSTVGYYNTDNGINAPSFSLIRFPSGQPGDNCDSKLGQEIPSSVVWTIAGETVKALSEGGMWYAPGIKAATLTAPITLTVTAKSGVYVWTVNKPGVGGQRITAVKQ